MELFEDQLKTNGFTVCRAEETLKEQMCKHAQSRKRLYYYYVQDCDCCMNYNFGKARLYKSTELTWYRYGPLCKECFSGSMSSLDCGGHYTNGQVFRQENISKKYWIGQPREPDPEEMIGLLDDSDSD